GDERIRAVSASLGLLKLAPMRVVVPLFAAIYRAPLGAADYSLHFVGPTGVWKTAMVALAQQHFGASMDARNLPASWSSTANALEEIAFQAKDIAVVMDDFIPLGSMPDVQRAHRDADRVLRAQGNRSGRQRMRADGTLRPVRRPRGTIVSTGEESPRGASLRSRILITEIEQSDIDLTSLTNCQNDAASGLYSASMAAYIQFLAPRYDAVRRSLPSEIARYRSEAIAGGAGHRRTPEIIANLAIGLRMCLDFAVE